MNRKNIVIYILIILAFILIFTLFLTSSKNRECLINNSWYKNKRLEFYSFGKFEEKPKYLIIHHSKAKNLKKLKSIFEDYGVSCHYFIDIDGKVHNIINNQCSAFHVGPSYWNGDTKLNTRSLCIEVINRDPFRKDISRKQYKALIKLSKSLMIKYDIKRYNVLSHSDVAVFADNDDNKNAGIIGLSNRKQDISYLFNWKKIAKHGIGFWYDDEGIKNGDILYYFGDKKNGIRDIKEKLASIGYKVEINDYYDVNLFMLSILFHRRFFPDQLIIASQGIWTDASSNVLNNVCKSLNKLRNN